MESEVIARIERGGVLARSRPVEVESPPDNRAAAALSPVKEKTPSLPEPTNGARILKRVIDRRSDSDIAMDRAIDRLIEDIRRHPGTV